MGKITSKMMYKGIQCVLLTLFLLNLMTAVHGNKGRKRNIDDMKRKWTEFFDMQDFDHNGNLTLAERDIRIKLIKEIYKKAEKNSDEYVKDVKYAYNCAYFRFAKHKSYLTREEFLVAMEKSYKENLEKFKENFMSCDKKYISGLDLDDDGKITWNEYRKHWGETYVIRKQTLKDDFLKWEPYRTVEEFSEAWLQFESEESPDPIDREIQTGLFKETETP